MPGMTFGPFELGNVNARTQAEGADFKMFERETFTGTHIPVSASAESGLLGYEVLKHFVITMDYKSGHVHIGTRASP